MTQTDSAVFYKYRMAWPARVLQYVFTLAIPAYMIFCIWSVLRHPTPAWVLVQDILLWSVFLSPVAWISAWAIVSADCVAEGMYCIRTIGVRVFIPWGQVRQFRRGIPWAHAGRRVWRICILRTDDRIPFCFLLDKDEMAKLISILREATNARIIGFD